MHDLASIGGSVVEFSPATRETGVRFPANARILKMTKGQFNIPTRKKNEQKTPLIVTNVLFSEVDSVLEGKGG